MIRAALISSEAFEEIAEKKMMLQTQQTQQRVWSRQTQVYGMGYCIVQRYWRRLWVSYSCWRILVVRIYEQLRGWLCCLSLYPATTLGIGGYIWCRSYASRTSLNALDSCLSAMAQAETVSKNIGRCRADNLYYAWTIWERQESQITYPLKSVVAAPH